MKNGSGRTILIIVALAAISTTWYARQVDAYADSEKVTSPFGLTSGQTARLNVLNSGEKNGIVVWKFLDSLGRVLQIPGSAPERQLIPPGQMRSFDLNADDLNVMRDRFGRIQMIAVVRAIGDRDIGGSHDDKNLHASLEVFDNATGKTTVFFPTETIKGFNPQPDQPGIQQ